MLLRSSSQTTNIPKSLPARIRTAPAPPSGDGVIYRLRRMLRGGSPPQKGPKATPPFLPSAQYVFWRCLESGRRPFLKGGGLAPRYPLPQLFLYMYREWGGNRPHAPQHQGAIAWDDPDLRIDWGVDPHDAILSERDRSAPRLRDLPPVAF